jgi:hypothetical protein
VTELPPIGEWVDCDAIEQLFDSHDSETELSVSFEFEEYQVFPLLHRSDRRDVRFERVRGLTPSTPVF